MISFPNAKINLGLHIIKKREDGFHNIETVFYPIQWNDVIEIRKTEGNNSIDLKTFGIEIAGDLKDNLISKAYNLLKEKYSLPALEICLLKNIPSGAGLGGGSADAAFFLKSIKENYLPGLSESELENYASKLGADCAFFIHNKSLFAKEKGNVFEDIRIDLSGYKIQIIYPGIHVSTPQAYAACKPRGEGVSELKQIIESGILNWKDHLENDFEKTVFPQFPELQKVKNKLYESGAVYASMSGSGSAIFGIFKSDQQIPEMNYPSRISFN